MKEWANKYNSFNSMKGLMYRPWYEAVLNGKFLPPVEVNLDPANACQLDCIWCVPEETQIMNGNLENESIENIKAGDYVLGMGNNKKLVKTKVLKVFKRHTQELVTLKLKNGEGLQITPEHAIFHTRGRWKKAKNYRVNDTVNTICNLERQYFNDNEFIRGWMCGIVDGDGCFWTVSEYNRRQFRIAMKDKDLIDRFYKYAKKYGFEVYKGNAQSKTRFGDFNLPAVYFTKNNEVKRFEKWLHNEPNLIYKEGWLGGIFDAEGSISCNIMRISQEKIEIKKRIIEYLKELGIKHIVEKKGVRIKGRLNERINFILRCHPFSARKRDSLLNHKISTITSVESFEHRKNNFNINVYNIETETQNYFANGILVHNCNGKKVKARNVIMERGHLLDLVSFFKSWGVKGLCLAGGGEPTLNPYLAEAMRLAKKIGLPVALMTNGLFRDSDQIKAAAECCEWIGVSFDCALPSTYYKFKGKDKHGVVRENVQKLVNYGAKEVCYKFLLHPENQEEVYIAIEDAHDLGCHAIHIRPLSFLNYKEVPEKYNVERIEQQVTRGRGMYEFDNFKVYYVTHKFDKNLHVRKDFKKCQASALIGIFEANGDIVLCIDQKNDDKLILGSHKNIEDIPKIWGSEKHKEIMRKVVVEECPKCTISTYQEIVENVIEKDSMNFCFP